MAKVFGIHMLELRPGVKGEDFERFVIEQVLPLGPTFPGVEEHILKGDRGDREGKYLFMFEFDSVESRNRFFPGPDQPSEEAQQHLDSIKAVMEKWADFVVDPEPPAAVTDYVAIEK